VLPFPSDGTSGAVREGDVDAKEIRELIEVISRSSFTTFELEREGFRMRLVKKTGGGPVRASEALSAPSGPPEIASAEPVETVQSDGLHELNSPIVGTFYRAPGPDTPAFAEVGGRVKKGQVVCIVEAMKVMNEIESEIDGEVVDIPVANGQPVEYGEVLFRLRPLN
jgi:acetyl-CoA carboxylase biotin carboxyl carrier protein